MTDVAVGRYGQLEDVVLEPAAPALVSSSEYLLEWLPELWFGLLIVALGGYLLLDGFDFGIGILFAWAGEQAREQMLAAFGPVWKANEVWLVFFGTVLFAGFPAVYANLLSRHYLLAFFILGALILRGLGAKLHEERDDDQWVRFWYSCFIGGSVLAPILLGMLVGSWMLGTATALAVGPVVVGVTVVALTVVLGSAFLSVKTTGELRQWALNRGQRATVGYVALFVLTAAVIYLVYPEFQSTLLSVPTVVVVAVTLASAGGVLWAGQVSQPRLALLGAGGMAVALVALVAHLLFPAADPAAGLSITDAIVSPLPLNIASLVALVFVPIVAFYFVFLYSVFSGPARPTDGY